MTDDPSEVGIDTEHVTWRPRSPAQDRSREARALWGETYEAAVPRPLSAVRLQLDAAVTAASDDARAAIARFDAEVRARDSLQGAEILPTIMLRSESLASSAIEGFWATVEDIAVVDAGGPNSSDALQVMANMRAMRAAIDEGTGLQTTSLLKVHAILMKDEPQAEPGVLRTQPVWIGGVGAYPFGAQFVPPRHERVPASLDDLWKFVTRTDVPLMTQIAVAHAQFETIHPFNDGNGRTGRALIHSMLRAADPTLASVTPISAGLLNDTDRYVDALNAFRAGDPNPIVACFCDATFFGINTGRALLEGLDEIQKRWTGQSRSRKGSSARRLLPVLIAAPVVTAKSVATELGVTPPAAYSAIKTLMREGVLTEYPGSRRSQMYVATDVLNIYETYSAQTRRPAAWPTAPAWEMD